MNIVWGIETTITPSGSTNPIEVAPFDLWKDVRLTKPTVSLRHQGEKVDITHNGITFTNIPTNWYLIEN